MAFISVKDFATGLAAKLRSVVVNTDENITAHLLQDSTGAEILGTKTDAKAAQTDGTALTFMQVLKQCSEYLKNLLAGVTLASGAASASASFTCGTTAYAARDAVGAASAAAALQFSSMGPSGGRVLVTGASLEIDRTALISGETNYELHFYNVTPPSAINDSAAWDLPSGDRASYLGYINLGTPVDLGSTLYVEVNAVNKPLKLAGIDIFAYLVSAGAYTPTAAVYKVTLHSVQV